ncbi:hypothetical protein MUN88_06365 [Gracilibacillus caseinilyticus]|uniref:Uncharacterized protein n=1 Tax=Gracilibacillus caseinilyticus TaxID=2932256 RepID=A0ABY4EZK5_9BACI|nr:hypothetical protein [Gracilibacillus caseinilyticus]UOQ49699.1 hypothetical protein MUN88_06365 [Gracilibacillus caseinilyticus]
MTKLEEGRTYLLKGVDGDKKAVKRAYEIFSSLRGNGASDALIEAYYGSTLALLGRDATKPIEKADNAQEGLDSLNQAVSMNPDHKEIRLLRSNVCLHLPDSFFQCSSIAIEDYAYLLDHYKKNPNYLSEQQVQDMYNELHDAFHQIEQSDQAKRVLKRLTELVTK